MKVALEINGEEKNSLTLQTKDVRPEDDFGLAAVDDTAVKVNKGDYVRISAYNDGKPAQPSDGYQFGESATTAGIFSVTYAARRRNG